MPLQPSHDPEDIHDIDLDLLYHGVLVTLEASMLLLVVFTSRYNLICEATKIIALALPHEHKLCSSLNEFKLFFKNLRDPLVKHFLLQSVSGIY